MFKKLIEFLALGLALARADVKDQKKIAELQGEVTRLTSELADARAEAPNAEEKATIHRLLAEFSAEVEPPAPANAGEEVAPPTPPPPVNDGSVVTPPESEPETPPTPVADGNTPTAEEPPVE